MSCFSEPSAPDRERATGLVSPIREIYTFSLKDFIFWAGEGGEGREPGGVLIWYCRVLSVSSLKNNHFLTFLWTVSQANTKRAYWKVDMAFHSLRKGQSCRSAFWQNFPFEFDGEQFLLYLVLRFIIYWVHQCWSKTCQSSIWGD